MTANDDTGPHFDERGAIATDDEATRHHRHGRHVSGPMPVDLIIPADIAHIRLARLVASGIGAEMSLDVTKIEDLRLVVNDACGIVLECSVAGRDPDVLSVEFVRSGHTLGVTVRRDGAIAVDEPSLISIAVLDEMASTWTFDRDRCTVSIEFPRGSG